MNQSGMLVPRALSHTAEVCQVRFSALNADEIEYLSVMEVTQARLTEAGEPAKGSVNDPRLGIIKPGQKCLTCGESKDCQGHFGHLKLVEPVFHVGYLQFVVKILKCVCHNCGKLKFFNSDEKRDQLEQAFRISSSSKRLNELVSLLKNINQCGSKKDGLKIGCGSYIPTTISVKEKMRLFVIEKENTPSNQQVQYSALRVKGILQKIFQQQRRILGFTVTKPTDLLITILAIAPPQVRPSVELGPEKRAEDDITNAYSRIVALNGRLNQMDSYERALGVREIQKLVASIMIKLDKKYLPTVKDKVLKGKKVSAKKIKSLEERLTSKQGRFRQHLMGKRVDFSARSVISPDPFLALDQVGVPERIASNMTVPEQINEFNFEKIVELCKKGSVKYLLQPQVGKRNPNFIYLNNLRTPQDIQKFVTFGTIAQRQLEDGDYVLFNRQPTLHRMSMMAHRVKILPLNTFRLNLSVCSPYNADFDGDEMNMHVPQSIEAVAQLKHIALVPKQVISPKNSTPIMGIVQDALLGIYLMTRRDTFLTREGVINLIVWIDPLRKHPPGDLPIPCILKPTPLWSGKQIISYLIPDKLSIKRYRQGDDYRNIDDRSGLLIKKGELLSGALQREHVGPGSGALVHAIWIQTGPQSTNEFITNTQRIVNCWLMNNSFSVGATDVMIDQELEDVRRKQIQRIKEDYYKNLHMFRNLPLYINENLHQKGKKVADSLEYKINLDLNNALSRMQKILSERISVHSNNIYKMITARSKGSETNLVQIMFCLGNQNVDGRRCPLGFKRRALPHFSKDDNSPEPRGFVFSSFFQGLKPHEFFFHSMAGRQGLSDTAVKTSSIGYIQRKLVKALEDLSIRYDGSVRDSQGNVLQRWYGEDGFQPEFIDRHKLNDCKLSQLEFKRRYGWNPFELENRGYNKADMALFTQELQELMRARGLLRSKMIRNGDTQEIEYHCPINIIRLVFRIKEDGCEEDTIDPLKAIEMVDELANSCVIPQFKRGYDSSLSKIKEMKNSGAMNLQAYLRAKQELVREAGMPMFHNHLKFWLCSVKVCREYGLSEKQLEAICRIIRIKFKQALAPPGEAIGSLAAQSIGEPTTQMTLNTFHLAGVSDKNVTLGIPRLRELLDVSRNIKTPYMTVYYYRRLFWEQRASEEMGHIQNVMLSMLPERHIKDCLASSRIYYDAGEFQSNIDGRNLDENMRSSRSPWVLSLQFETEKITSAPIWRRILEAVREKYGTQFEVLEYVGIGEDRCPEVQMRMTSETSGRRRENAYKYIMEKEIELKDIFLSGMKGIKSIKTARKISYEYGNRDQMDLSLERRQDELVFDAVGSNLKECLINGYVDPVKTTSNDLYQIYKVLGIEAARQCFMNQIKQILKPYSIYINNRHIAVLADWMSSRGTLTPVNRHGINRVRDVSILRKASFQETVDVLYSAAAFSEVDNLRGISERIIFGEKINLGTNICQVYVDTDRVSNYTYQPVATISANTEQEDDLSAYAPNDSVMHTPKGLATPQLSFMSSQHSPLHLSHSSSSMSPSYSSNHEGNLHDTSMQSSSPNYTRVSFSKSCTPGESARMTQSPTYSSGLLQQMSTDREGVIIMKQSKSPSYDRKQAVRPSENLFKEQESGSSESEEDNQDRVTY